MSVIKKKLNFNTILFANLVFGFFPISFIFGNLFININVALFCILGIVLLKSKALTTKVDISLKIIFLLFFIIFFSTIISVSKIFYFEGYYQEHMVRLIKSMVFFRYFLMIFLIYLMCQYSFLNFKFFFISAASCSIIISLDVIYQYYMGFNLIGLKSFSNNNSSFFGTEVIAGGFIQNFSFFSIFFIAFFFREKNAIKFFLTILTICILGIGILLSGNRMPLILFLFGLVIAFILNKKLRKIILLSLLFLFIIFKSILSSDETFRTKYISMYQNIVGGSIVPALETLFPASTLSKIPTFEKYLSKNDIGIEKTEVNEKINQNEAKSVTSYGITNEIFLTAIDIWIQNKILGNGMKSFREDCVKGQKKFILLEDGSVMKHKPFWHCSNHPHNYYFEILTDTGIVGFCFVLIIAIFFIAFVFKNLRFFRGGNFENFFILATTISLILETFPFKSTGSIFSTNNATYVILLASIILGQSQLLSSKNNR